MFYKISLFKWFHLTVLLAMIISSGPVFENNHAPVHSGMLNESNNNINDRLYCPEILLSNDLLLQSINDELADKEFNISCDHETGIYHSSNSKNDLIFQYHRDGFTARPLKAGLSEWSVSLNLSNVKRNTQDASEETMHENFTLPVFPTKLTLNKNTAYIENENVRIDYTNNAAGMRQDFIVKKRPVGTGNLELNISAESKLKMNVDAGSVTFKDKDGNEKMKYSSLKVWDATGRELRSHFKENNESVSSYEFQVTREFSDKGNLETRNLKLETCNSFSILVNDDGAIYPVTVDPLSSSPNWTGTGPYSFGTAISSAGDVNNDGYDDVIVGAKETSTNFTNDGKAFLFLGSSAGLSTTPAWTAIGANQGSVLGISVSSAGDVNGDGYNDIIIGESGYKVGANSKGRALVYHGTSSGLSSTPSWTKVGLTTDFGRCVSTAGDVNNDGYSDVIVSTAYGGIDTITSIPGAVFVYLGSASGLSSTHVWQAGGTTGHELFGLSVGEAGDVNNDGFDDVIVGSPDYFGTLPGRALVYHGTSTGVSTTASWIKSGEFNDDNFGFAVYTAGDVNDDGYSDVIVGAPDYESDNRGKAYVFHGSASGLSTSANWTAIGSAGHQFGYDVKTAGDYGQDGISDVIVGAPQYNSAYVFKGSFSGLSSGSAWTVRDTTITVLGFKVSSAGDVNGDGFSDAMVGAYTTKAFVYHGSADPPVVVTGANAGNGTYNTLASAFNAINSASQSGANILISLYGNTNEPVSGAVLNNGSWSRIIIQPAGGLPRTVTAGVTAGLQLINLNGADNVTIDGLNSGGNSLTLSNTTVSNSFGTSTISLRNDASNNIITRCTVLGSSTNQYSSANIFFDYVNVTGNNNNLIAYCEIGPAGSNLPTIGVLSFGGGSQHNSGDTIRNCNIYDYFNTNSSSSGVYLATGSSNFIIKDNKFYQTAQRTLLSTGVHYAIRVESSSGNNFMITGNKIGYASSSGTGMYSFTGNDNSNMTMIHLSVDNSIPSVIRGNTIAGISISGPMVSDIFYGIFEISLNGGSADISSNTIGSMTNGESIVFNTDYNSQSRIYGIRILCTGSRTVSDNLIGGITASNLNASGRCYIVGIGTQISGTFTCSNNTIGGNITNSILSTTTTTFGTRVIGIECQSGTSFITGNTIRNLASAGAGGSLNESTVSGISCPNTGINNIIQNTVYGLSCTNPSASGPLAGIYSGTAGPNIISRNKLHSFSAASSGSVIFGTITGNNSNATFQNNMIRLGLDTSGNSMSASSYIFGMYEFGGNNNYYFNSVYIGGILSTGVAYSSAFNSEAFIGGSRIIKNNIFYNARTNNSASVKHYSVRISDLSFNSDHNVLYAPNTGGTLGFYDNNDYQELGLWRTATGQDNNSLRKDPQYVNPSGSASTYDLHITNTVTPVEQRGIDIPSVTEDFDGQLRSGLTPTDIGADAGNFSQTSPLSGDYTVGLSMFNSIAGTNIYFEKTLKRVLKEVEDNSDQNELRDGSEVKKVIKEVEEEVFVPMQNGKIYEGPLFVKRNNNPEIPGDAMLGVYATINAALNDLYSSGVNGPVRFLLIDANYNSETLPITISQWNGASSANTLTIKPAAGVNPTISGAHLNSIFDINGADHFNLDGSNTNNGTTKDLTLSNTNFQGSVIRIINDAKRNVIKNCVVKGSTINNSKGVVFFSTTNGASGNDSNTIQNNDITWQSTFPAFGIYNSGTGATSDTKNSYNKITGNRIFDFSSRGIFDEGNSKGNIYESNEIFTSTLQAGHKIGFRVAANSIEGFTFRNNLIHNLRTTNITLVYGIELSQIQDGFTGEIYNNFISLFESNSNDLKGIFDGSPASNSYDIYFNSINIYSGSGGLRNSECYHRANATNTNFKNNILVNSRVSGSGKHYAIRTVTPLTNFNCNYNDIFNTGGTGNVFARLDAADISNLSGWQSSTAKDQNSISSDPLFVGANNLHIDTAQSSPVSNAGTFITGIVNDYDFNTRGIIPDIGADEFGPVSNAGLINLSLIVEGFYNAASNNMNLSDTVKIYLRNATAPYAIVDSSVSVINANSFTGSFLFSNAVTGNYYVQTDHRNTIETWSKTPVSYVQAGAIAYDFTTAATQAFGDNMKQVDGSPLRYGIFSGDVNGDGVVDGSDAALIDNDAYNFVSGYVITDLTGDEVIDGSDAAIADNNASNFISKVTP